MNTLYVSDLDGTLLGTDSRVSERSRILLNDAIGHGTRFTIATARTPATVAALLKGIDMRLDAIVMTGAAWWNASTGRYSHVKHFPADMAKDMIGLLRQQRYPAFIYTLEDNLIRIYRLGAMSENEKEFIAGRGHTPYKKVMFDTGENGDVWHQPMPDPAKVILFYSLQPIGLLESFHPHITARLPQVNALHYCDHDLADHGLGTLEVFAPGATKAAAVREMAREIKAERTVVFGDNVNDLSMMRSATLGVAPANAITEVKELAGAVIGSNADDAVAEYIHTDTMRRHKNDLTKSGRQ